jgi:hypothetical protein
MSFTGYLLPWDQLAMWAVTVGTNMAGATPFLGNEGPFSSLVGMHINNDVRFVLLGGTMVGENTLLRFYVLHCVAVPVVVGTLLILHFWRIRKDSFSAAPIAPNEEKVDVWPRLVTREYIAAAGCIVVIMLWSVLMNAPLEALANPNVTPNPSKAPWYFVGLQELLVYFDPWIAGVVMPNLIIVGLMAIPYIDTNPKGIGYYSWKERPFANTLFLLGVAMWFVLIFIGYYCRGPNFAWYWPWQSWLIQQAPPPDTWNLFGPKANVAWYIFDPANKAFFPAWIGVLLLIAGGAFAMLGPKLIQREINGKKANLGFLGAVLAVVIVAHFAKAMTWTQGGFLLFFGWMGFYFGFLLPQRHIRALEWPRYLMTMLLVISTMAVPLKMAARLCFNIKYVLNLPGISLNI